ncbi:response regulator [Halorubellus salinus]|uniref:response regulator n=1 Tax=Halorubellus salinus TaxID=755309 RepID=UPI001D09857D|nr:response regulator [Halorubellus salinus]
MTEDACVLVVDDEVRLADMFSRVVGRRHETRTAYGGEEALELVDDDVDVVLLDRRMPDKTGDEVLREVKAARVNCRVVMVTAVDPEMDVLKLPFDDYLCKPVETDVLLDVVDQQLEAQAYDDRLTEYMSVVAKLGVLEATAAERDLVDRDAYGELKTREAALREDLEAALEEFDDVARAFRAIPRA